MSGRIAVIAGVVAASALASTLIVSAQRRQPQQPPCNRFDNPGCHPSPPLVTKKAAQTVEGDVNVSGKICVGSGSSRFCLGGSGGGTGGTTTGALTLLQQPLDMTSKGPAAGSTVKLNMRTVIQKLTGSDPGAIKGVILRAVVGPAFEVYNHYSNSFPEYLGPQFFASSGDGDAPSAENKHAIVMTTYLPNVKGAYGYVLYGNYNLASASGVRVVVTNANSEIQLRYEHDFESPYYWYPHSNSRYPPTKNLFIDGYYK